MEALLFSGNDGIRFRLFVPILMFMAPVHVHMRHTTFLFIVTVIAVILAVIREIVTLLSVKVVAVITAAIVGFGIPLWMLYPYIIMTRNTREDVAESHLHTYFEYLLDDGGERNTREDVADSHLHTYFEYLLDDGGEDG
ncbi:unnamed protein product [Macrosiphum euphorbiae]|uniref:Uncharacterized protein n=1 Tax=Macrosiphum euphorbiae TaxID=13131 RepID=A0AAV0WK05_9HEMI|nr:unnamed protein product [Macrosiphum euphorbiae]